jgi:hypothetical protein
MAAQPRNHVRFPTGATDFFSKIFRPVLQPNLPHIDCVPDFIFAGIKRRGREGGGVKLTTHLIWCGG